jgi:PIN domain nuclease of toxin-antitoxin system
MGTGDQSKSGEDRCASVGNGTCATHGGEGFSELPIGLEHAVRAGLLPLHHGDPFDRLLVAQAQAMNVPILSADEILDRYDVKRIW